MRLFALALTLWLSFGAPAAELEKGFVSVDGGRRLWVEHRPAARGKPTLFLLNGLTWTTRDWSAFVSALDPELGIVLYDMEGMGRTLLDRAPVRWDIPFTRQVDDLRTLVDRLAIKGKISVAGLSYGGAVALAFAARHPRVFDKVIAMAPFLERLKDQDSYLKATVNGHRVLYPWDPRSDEELYDFYLRGWVYSVYPLTEPEMLDSPYLAEGVYRMVKGAKSFRAADLTRDLPPGRLHLIGAVDDEYVLDRDLGAFWKCLSINRQMSYLRIGMTKHKIPQLRPELSASWVEHVLEDDPRLGRGLVWDVNPLEAVARGGNEEIVLNKAGACESLLRNVWSLK